MAELAKYIVKPKPPKKVEVRVGASEASATICWVGGILDDGDCNKCYDEKIYCENVYIGTNDCVDGESSGRTIEGTITWNGLTVEYIIYQEAAICSDCGSATTECEILNYWVSPYVVTPSISSTTLYWEYWLTKEDDCEIFREKVLSSTTINVSTNIPCDQKDREFPISAKTECGDSIIAKYYIQKPDVCCDLTGDCYEINEIVYNPTSVPSEGGLVDFSFDYKRIEIDENCEPKETYGTYFGKWQVPPCKGDDCCFPKMVQSAFTWFDICGRGDVSGCEITSLSEYNDGDLVYIPSSGTNVYFSSNTLNDKNTIYLSILRDKSISADCEIHCDFDTVYCVNKDTIKKEYYDYDTGKWSSFTGDEYIYPYYGGRIRVSWEYYIITIYEDCTVGVSVGNKHSDLLTIPEYDDCNDHEDFDDFHININYNGSSSSCNIVSSGDIPPSGGDVKYSIDEKDCPNSITVTPQGNCYGKTTNSSKSNTRGEGSEGGEPSEDFIMNEIPYEFKKGLCDLLPSQLEYVKRSLPDYLQNVCDEEEKCNEFTVTCYQYKKECDLDCVPCLDNYMIDNVPSGGTTVERYFRSSCVVKEIVYGDGEMVGSTFKNDCSDWVKATINGDTVTFKIEANIINGKTGPYRRGKVIFIHDNNCKEEVIINQHGTSDNEDYEPDPGYECDLAINYITICLGESGTITPIGGSETCDETKITFYPNATSITVGGCGGNYLIGNYSYKCSNFDIEKLGFYPKGQGMYKVIVTNDVDNRKGTITGVFDENPNTQQRVIEYTIEYDGSDIKNGGIHTIMQEIIQGDCNKEFDTLLEEFNEVLGDLNLIQISSIRTPNVYNYLKDGYDRALEEYEGHSELFDESFYNEVYNYHGTNTEYHDTAKNAMLSWLMAMQLSELYADSGVTTNTQTELFLKAYNIGGGRSVPVYNENDLHSDVFIARYAASAIYAITRANYTFEQMDSLFRTETNTTPIDRLDSSWTDTKQVTEATCDGSYDPSNSIGYALNLNDIFPNASGPYADNFYNGGLICRTVASRTPDPLQPSSQFNSTTKNYTVDEQIDSIVTSNYNLSANDTDLARTVQAIADDDDSILQMLGGITYYKYNASSPLNSFTLGTPSDNMGSFHGTFNKNVIGKDLSSLLSDSSGNETALRYFYSGVSYLGGHSRQTILDPQYGRRRPGQGEGDALYNGSTLVLTSTPRCLCNSGCNTNLNYLNDGSIERLIGGGTKNDPRHYYADINGNGQWDSSEPYINDGGGGSTNPCAGLHASTYPSGHSSEVWTVAMFLMQMIPSKYKEIYKAAYDYTVSRTIVRAHWNSDTMYGKLVATTMTPIINAFRNAHNGQNVRSFYNAAKTMIDNAPSVNIQAQSN